MATVFILMTLSHKIVVQVDTLWYLHMYLKYILVGFTPSIILSLPSSRPS
jgi:hypothetical protein